MDLFKPAVKLDDLKDDRIELYSFMGVPIIFTWDEMFIIDGHDALILNMESFGFLFTNHELHGVLDLVINNFMTSQRDIIFKEYYFSLLKCDFNKIDEHFLNVKRTIDEYIIETENNVPFYINKHTLDELFLFNEKPIINYNFTTESSHCNVIKLINRTYKILIFFIEKSKELKEKLKNSPEYLI